MQAATTHKNVEFLKSTLSEATSNIGVTHADMTSL
jgi:hypothetical protein